MFMTTTLGHYQLPLFGISSSALQTEIGADQRSLFLRPITSAGSMTELAGAEVVAGVEKVTPPMEFRKWMEALYRYENGAQKSGDADQSGTTVPAAGPVGAQNDGPDLAATGNQEPGEPQAAQPAGADSVATAAPEPASEPATPQPAATSPEPSGATQPAGSTQRPGGLLGGIIRF